MKTEAWWVCHCGQKVIRVGRKRVKEAMTKHSETCFSPAYAIKQVTQCNCSSDIYCKHMEKI